jgi:hypothetical protein
MPLASGAFVACFYETAPKWRNAVARLLLLPLELFPAMSPSPCPSLPAAAYLEGERREHDSGRWIWAGEIEQTSAHLLSVIVRWCSVSRRGYGDLPSLERSDRLVRDQMTFNRYSTTEREAT